jgi:hypothetical protein
MDYLPPVLVGAFLLLAAWLFLQPRYDFTIRITDGQPHLGKGKVPAAFLGEVGEVCREHGVTRGAIHGIRKGPHLTLAFSGRIPKSCQQQLRNLWALPR